MCNAWNHSAGCGCGFGGDTGGGGWAAPPVPLRGTRSIWRYRDENFCRPTSCPICGAAVYFVRHNGGSVWFDELGPPWLKHGCFDDEPAAANLRTQLTRAATSIFGLVIETTVTTPRSSGRIVVRCSDGSMIDDEFNTTLDLVGLVGRLVLIERGNEKRIRLVPLHVPLPLPIIPPMLLPRRPK